MLTPEYYDGKDSGILEIYRDVEDYILITTIRSLMSGVMISDITNATSNQKIKHSLKLKKLAEKKLNKATKQAMPMLDLILFDAVIDSWEYDAKRIKEVSDIDVGQAKESKGAKSIIKKQQKKSRAELKKISNLILANYQCDILNMMDEIQNQVRTGAYEYRRVLCDNLDKYAKQGVRLLYNYRNMSIDTAIRNCVTTSISQVASKATFQFMREANINLVLVSAHIGARFTPFIEPANHQSWQGQIYEVAQEDLKKM